MHRKEERYRHNLKMVNIICNIIFILSVLALQSIKKCYGFMTLFASLTISFFDFALNFHKRNVFP